MVALLLSGILATPPVPERTWALEAMSALRREFKLEREPGYADSIGGNGNPTPVFNWGAGVLLAALADAAEADPGWKPELQRFAEAVEVYWNPAGPVPGFDVLPIPKPTDRYYDDNAWMALALVRTADVLGDARFLDRAEAALRYVLSGEDSRLGGGIYWRESDRATKNACSNAPAAAACLALHAKRPKPELLKAAKRLYRWTRDKLRDPKDGLYWDSIALDGKVDRTKWSYNSALMIRCGYELGRVTRDSAYSREADALALASETRWIRDRKLDDVGRFAHLLVESWVSAPSSPRDSRILDAVGWLRREGRHANGLYGPSWNQLADPKRSKFELLDQASAARTFFLAARLRARL